jgi:RHS repeat-associated protein
MLATTKNQLQDTNNDFVYDAAGNLTQLGPSGGSYVFDAENHLTSAAGVTYTYDGDGNRVMKSNGTIYWYGANSASIEETDLSGNFQRAYYFFNGQRVARQLPTNEVGFYMTDHLGNVRYLGGSATGYSIDYYPYGGIIVNSDIGDDRYQFTGKERDSESNLDNFGARFDSSQWGRFLSPDKLVDQHTEDPQSMNLYAYVRNRPLTDTDPSGHFDCDKKQSVCQSAIAADAKIRAASFDINNPNIFALQKISDTLGTYGDNNGVTLMSHDFTGTQYEDANAVTFGKAIVFSSKFSGSTDETAAVVMVHEGTHVMQNERADKMSLSWLGMSGIMDSDSRPSWQGQINLEKEAFRNQGYMEQALHMKGQIYDPSDVRPGAAARMADRIDSGARKSVGITCPSVGDTWLQTCQP